MPRIATRQVSFAEVELKAHVKLDPVLQCIAEFLDQAAGLPAKVGADLARGLKRPHTGRDGVNPVRVLRAFVLSRIKNWDLRELSERISDGHSLRIFTTFNAEPVPSHRAFGNAFSRLTPETIREINDAVIHAAGALKLEDGAHLRVDTSVVETDIHYPTDSTLLWDVVRVLCRQGLRLLDEMPNLGVSFPDRRRRAKRRSQEISRLTKREGTRPQVRKYRDLVRVAEEVMDNAQRLAARAQTQLRCDIHIDPMRAALISALAQELTEVRQLGQQVVAQTRRRVFGGEQVPPQDKIYSVFEPHTDMIIRGKARTPVEFGHKILLAESGHGLITDYRVLRGNPSDQDHVPPVLERHTHLFGGPPKMFAADRGFYSEDNVAACTSAGVENESIPQRGGRKSPEREAHESSTAFRKGQRFRAGVEGRISVLFRGRGMKRCLCQGLGRFEVFVGMAVLANNLLVLAGLLRQKRSTRRLRPA
jgi:transposase, IS5 family